MVGVAVAEPDAVAEPVRGADAVAIALAVALNVTLEVLAVAVTGADTLARGVKVDDGVEVGATLKELELVAGDDGLTFAVGNAVSLGTRVGPCENVKVPDAAGDALAFKDAVSTAEAVGDTLAADVADLEATLARAEVDTDAV